MHCVTNIVLQNKRASEWIQFYLDPIRIRGRAVTVQDVVGRRGRECTLNIVGQGSRLGLRGAITLPM